MELKEFVRLNPDQVRRDKELMQLFVNFYEAAFSFIPKCVGCAFKSGFRKLKKYAETSEKNIKFDKTLTIMESKKTFLLKKQYQLKILTYKSGGITHRSYGYNLTEEFAKDLVNAGKSDLFATLPTPLNIEINKEGVKEKLNDLNLDASIGKSGNIINDEPKISKYELMHHQKELLPLYAEVKERTGKKALSNRKSDIIAFLIENES